MSTMTLHSGAAGRSSLNPNALLFIPMAYQQVEDFSPEWWELVKTTPWFRDHWFHQHREQESFDYDDNEDVADLLPDYIDLSIIDDDFSITETNFNQAVFNESLLGAKEPISDYLIGEKSRNAGSAIGSLSLKSPKNGIRELEKNWEKPPQLVRSKYSPRHNIQQPR